MRVGFELCDALRVSIMLIRKCIYQTFLRFHFPNWTWGKILFYTGILVYSTCVLLKISLKRVNLRAKYNVNHTWSSTYFEGRHFLADHWSLRSTFCTWTFVEIINVTRIRQLLDRFRMGRPHEICPTFLREVQTWRQYPQVGHWYSSAGMMTGSGVLSVKWPLIKSSARV